MTQTNTISSKLLLSIFATGIMAFSGIVSETAMNVTFPTLMKEFDVGTSTVQWLTTGYLLMLALVVPLSSFLKKRFSAKDLFLFAIALFIGATIYAGLSTQFAYLLIARLIQGGATGIALPLMFNIIITQAPKQKIGMLMGIATLIVAMAPAVGPVLGGVVIDFYGWRMVFFLLLPLLFLALAAGIFAISPTNSPEKVRFDFIGYFLLAVSFASFIFATEKTAHYGWFDPLVLGLLVLSLVALSGFVLKAKQGKNPLIHLAVFQYKPFVLSLLFILSIQFNVLALGYLIPNYAQIATHSSAFIAGFLLLPGCLVGAFIAPFSGKLLDRMGAKKPILQGAVLIVLSLTLFSVFGQQLSTILIMLFYLIYAIGQGFSVGNMMTNGLRQLPVELSADGNAVINTLQQLAGATGTSVVASIVANQQQKIDLTQGTMLGSQQAFILLMLFSVFGLFCAVKTFQIQKK
ncbi:multidrug efflux MFS transporter [Lonepinella koalarum]|uniref:DHA2 family efflux MFS transporter permease subunit n=1 Tax=Lonepinella koalarum TaxID=53417 RepID=UPI0011E49895|nr:DHA2 family efflux MFS transporter permease subunit [Lonepinella koalarum]TYG34643.1 multidrug efflux MFS transporter [Lonepinella koalarum]